MMDLFYGCFDPQTSCGKCVERCKGSRSTPLPKAKVFVVLALAFGNVFGSVVIFPFLPFMVQDFYPHLNKEELGQQAGYLGSAYFMGGFAGSMVWGWLADTWGRRPALLLGSVGIMFTSLLFGFSQSFAMAVTARFLWGILNGNFSIAKTYLSEILDDTNQAKGFSIFGMASGLGRIFGSVVGGFLSQPASKYSLFENPFFCHYQYILPIFFNVGVAIVGFFGVFFIVEETLRLKPKSNDSANVDSSSNSVESTETFIEMTSLNSTGNHDNHCDTSTTSTIVISNTLTTDTTGTHIDSVTNNGNAITHRVSDKTSFNTDINEAESAFSDEDPLLSEGIDEVIQHQPVPNGSLNGKRLHIKTRLRPQRLLNPVKHFLEFQKKQLIECCYCCLSVKGSALSSISGCSLWSKLKQAILLRLKLLWDRRVIMSVLGYGFVGGVTILSNEIYPLILVTDHEHGGYSMDDNEIALFIMIAGVVLLVYQVFAFSQITKAVGYRNLLRISLIIFAIGNFMLPWANRITGPIGGTEIIGSGSSGMGTGPTNNTELGGYCRFNYSTGTVNEDSVTRLPAGVWAIMLVLSLMIIIGRISSLVTLVVLINNSAVTETRGTVNGLGQTLLSVFRSLTPAVGSILFAWSEINGLNWPLNYHLTFDLCACGSVAIVLFTLLFPKSIEKKRTS